MKSFWHMVRENLACMGVVGATERIVRRCISDAVEEVEAQEFRCGIQWTPEQCERMRRSARFEECS